MTDVPVPVLFQPCPRMMINFEHFFLIMLREVRLGYILAHIISRNIRSLN